MYTLLGDILLPFIKGIVHTKMRILSSFTHPPLSVAFDSHSIFLFVCSIEERNFLSGFGTTYISL